MCPNRSYVILEGRDDIGGTWDLFRYPGVRSDSDMHTLGYRFKPWTAAKAIADGPSILAYLRETVAEFGIDRHIRFGTGCGAPSGRPRTPRGPSRRRVGDGDRHVHVQLPVHVLRLLQLQRAATTPRSRVASASPGRLVHPQFWPEDLDYAGKRVVVIGSGATAMTLVPAMAADAAHVTMLQRSPTYVVSRPSDDVIANGLRKVLPDKLAYDLTRRKNVALQQFFYGRTRKQPEKVKAQLIGLVTQAARRRLTTSTRTSRRATTRGTSACA